MGIKERGWMNNALKFMEGYQKGQEIKQKKDQQRKMQELMQRAMQSGNYQQTFSQGPGGITRGLSPQVDEQAKMQRAIQQARGIAEAKASLPPSALDKAQEDRLRTTAEIDAMSKLRGQGLSETVPYDGRQMLTGQAKPPTTMPWFGEKEPKRLYPTEGTQPGIPEGYQREYNTQGESVLKKKEYSQVLSDAKQTGNWEKVKNKFPRSKSVTKDNWLQYMKIKKEPITSGRGKFLGIGKEFSEATMEVASDIKNYSDLEYIKSHEKELVDAGVDVDTILEYYKEEMEEIRRF